MSGALYRRGAAERPLPAWSESSFSKFARHTDLAPAGVRALSGGRRLREGRNRRFQVADKPEHLGEAQQMEGPSNVRGGCGENDLAAILPGDVDGGDKAAEAGGRDVRDFLEVQNEPV